MATETVTKFNLSTFRAKVTSIARNQYFIVRIPQVGTDDVITALARTTEMPAVTHNTLDIPYRGLNMKIDDRPQFSDWSVNFLCDEAMSLRNLFIQWQSRSYNIQNMQAMAHSEYKRDSLSVSQLAADGRVAATTAFFGAWPTAVGAVGFDQAGGNVQTFDVSFAFDYFLMNDLQGDVVSTAGDQGVFINVDDAGVMAEVTIPGMAGVRYNIQAGAMAIATT